MKYNTPFVEIDPSENLPWRVYSSTYDGKTWGGWKTEVWAATEQEAISTFKLQNPTHKFNKVERITQHN